eukprot:TRINITY_DN16749_c0_g1_i1.p1 TRINITY_DN16749_c0_g1~~TRINITY_DN16749_c0_g1_i1.p1  ORF type:complete len:353 (+),score=7.52 TRINITY_DN16749_c0_g1_i1:152-1060(+)
MPHLLNIVPLQRPLNSGQEMKPFAPTTVNSDFHHLHIPIHRIEACRDQSLAAMNHGGFQCPELAGSAIHHVNFNGLPSHRRWLGPTEEAGQAAKGLQLICAQPARGNHALSMSTSSSSLDSPASPCLAELVSEFMEMEDGGDTGSVPAAEMQPTGADTTFTSRIGITSLLGPAEGTHHQQKFQDRHQNQQQQYPQPPSRRGNSSFQPLEDNDGAGALDDLDLSRLVESLSTCQTAPECNLFVDVISSLNEAKKIANEPRIKGPGRGLPASVTVVASATTAAATAIRQPPCCESAAASRGDPA